MLFSDASQLSSALIGGGIVLSTGVLVGSLLAYSVFVPSCQFWAPVMRSIPQPDAVALTFDDGPHHEFTSRILDILAAHSTRASFFVIGRLARQNPGILRRIHAEGHTLGNHSLDHDHFGVNRGRLYWHKQLADTQKIIADITGQPPLFFRPPMGFKTWHIAAAARELHLPMAGWSVRACDTRPIPPQLLADRLLKGVKGRDIVLLHDGLEPARAHASQRHTVEALPALLTGFANKGLRLLPLSDALPARENESVTEANRT